MQCIEKPMTQVLRPEALARSILTDMGIVKPPVIAINVANCLGIGIEFVKLDKLSEHVVSFIDPKRKTISINDQAPALLYNFSVARDIGLWLMHPDYVKSDRYRIRAHTEFYDMTDPYSRDATQFALALLTSKEILSYIGEPDLIRKAILQEPAVVNKLAEWHQVPPRAMRLSAASNLV